MNPLDPKLKSLELVYHMPRCPPILLGLNCLPTMKHFLFLAAIALSLSASAQKLTSKDSYARINASTPVEDVDAVLNNGVGILNTETNEAVWQLQMQSFTFKRALMQEHFNESYMESEKYPKATLKAKIEGVRDWTKPATYKGTIKGQMEIHGVKKDVSVPSTITVNKDGSVTVESEFSVRTADYGIKIPTLVVMKVAEVVTVTVKSTLKNAQ
ncbi:MAG: polyisoprenoid-binding protein [Flavobacteriales bacterium]|nr:MAG: polyisoprenoid-binding protein [Flavobacteriales bacterium]